MRNIAIIGSTGSIGTQTLEVVRENKDLSVKAIAAGRSIELLEKQAREFKPDIVGIWSREDAESLKASLRDTDIRVVYGMEGLLEIAAYEPVQILVTAIVGMIGLKPTVRAIECGKDIALANKETLVTAGHIIMPLAREKNVRILPVDSEHSAIFQALNGERKNHISRILLTASGGPFRGKDRAFIENATVEDALKHPNWSMGQKITVDSASLVNKGLEVIEAKHLFDVTPDRIEVVVQPQSVIHSMVEFDDGAVMAQLGTPDMKLPIQYALYYPERRFLKGERLDFAALQSISFEEPQRDVFKGLDFAYAALAAGGSMPTVFNAANEYAVAMFLSRKISFTQIYDIIEYSMTNHRVKENPSIEEILETQRETEELIRSKYSI